jgi:uncharacterized membrane protein (DUF2068 family)
VRRKLARITASHYNPDPHAHPGLHVIAIVEAVKGALAVMAASGLELIGPASLQRWVHELIDRFQLDPDHGAMSWLASAIGPDSVHFAATVALFYGLAHLTEAWGLWRAKAWASWLGCLSAAAYLPFDLYALSRHRGWLPLTVVAINLLVVWVLGRDLVKRKR